MTLILVATAAAYVYALACSALIFALRDQL